MGSKPASKPRAPSPQARAQAVAGRAAPEGAEPRGARRSLPSEPPPAGERRKSLVRMWFLLFFFLRKERNVSIGHHLNTNILTKILHWLFTVIKAYSPGSGAAVHLSPPRSGRRRRVGTLASARPPGGRRLLRRLRAGPRPSRERAWSGAARRPRTPPRNLRPWSPPVCCW